ncbi:MAG: HD domain-containing protein [Cyanobacteria bacterium RM1_2_2]|nr:HD domain-containing protein [Cyanobacteria bacterium RM1_2_2]
MTFTTGLSRTYHDPLHGAILLDGRNPVEALLIQLIDTPAFQRLRRIRQLGPASLTFHGAEASRFTHSLGVMTVARRAFDRLAGRYPQLQPYRATVLCAALLHDIGHGPFSHTCEEIFGYHHEQWTERILRESLPIRMRLDAFDAELLPQIEQVYHKRHPVACVWQLVSSQLDCDRLDYLMRDSYFTGASYGKLDLDRIILAMGFDPVTQQLTVAQKGMTSVEHYLMVRYFMYVQVYNHHKNIAATWVLEHAFQRAHELFCQGEVWADETVAAWLQPDCNVSLQQYLRADDGVFIYHLQRWQQHADPILADLCRRFVDRDLFKATDVTAATPERQQILLQRVQKQLVDQGLEYRYYTGLRTTQSSGYTLYQQGIKLQTEQGLREISDVSPLIRTLTQGWQRSWLIHPREAKIEQDFSG